jgi:dephospho-CoA kinase
MRVGLTGGIGSGKSVVARLLVERGADLVDTDGLARSLTQVGGAAIEPLRQAFGAHAIGADGALDRAWMRRVAFSDEGARRRLEAILHPLIGETVEAATRAASATLLVFDVPLLVESGRWRARVDRVLVVDCAESTQIERVVRRSGWAEDQVRAVMAQQATRAARRAAADAVLYNDGLSLDALGDEVSALLAQWGLAGLRGPGRVVAGG